MVPSPDVVGPSSTTRAQIDDDDLEDHNDLLEADEDSDQVIPAEEKKAKHKAKAPRTEYMKKYNEEYRIKRKHPLLKKDRDYVSTHHSRRIKKLLKKEKSTKSES